MNYKLFVGGISWDTKDDGLKAFFEQAGEVVEAIILMDKFTGRSRGYGFVTMADEAGFNAALELDGQELDGRALKVDEARPPKQRD